VHPSTQCTAAPKIALHVPLESFQILKLVKSQQTGSLLPNFQGFHFLLQRWEEPPLVDWWKLACLVYVAPYLIVQAYYTCNLNPVEIKLLASNISNGEISGLSSTYHGRTWMNKNGVVQTIAFPSGPGWEKQCTPQYEVCNPVKYIWDFHLPNPNSKALVVAGWSQHIKNSQI
jgi:hypothetical protein